MSLPRALLCGLLLVLCVAGAGAHEVRPVVLTLVEQQAGLHTFTLRVPASVEADNQPRVEWPADCAADGVSRVRCREPLAGRTLVLRWPLYNPAVTTLARFTPRDGETRTTLLPPQQAQWRVPAAPTARAVSSEYFRLGVHHILGGADHLLFVAGLMLVTQGRRRLLLAVSGFTLAHSLTLSLAALGLIHVPVPPTEAAIALSILFLAREALRPDAQSLARRHPMVVSALFGMLHGLGFAAALGETGLPGREITWALLSFNLGVEAGQIAFIALLLLAAFVLQRLLPQQPAGITRRERWLRVGGAYVIGVPAAFWLLQRLPIQPIW